MIGTDPVHKQTVLFGGLADVNPVNTWTYDGRTWTEQFPSTQPSERLFTGTVYDPRFGGVVTFGGFAGTDVNDTWLWSGTDWINSPRSSRHRRASRWEWLSMHCISRRSCSAGKMASTLLNGTWVLQTQ